MKYIDADKLYKKIDERMAKFAELEKETEPNDTDLSIFYQGKRKMCSEILTLITSLQQEQPEVDLEKILDSPVVSTWHSIDGKLTLVKRYSDEQVIQAYELGRNTRKEE